MSHCVFFNKAIFLIFDLMACFIFIDNLFELQKVIKWKAMISIHI